jgi:hypothetical protein
MFVMGHSIRVETKIVVYVFSQTFLRKFILFYAKISLRKLTKLTENCLEIFAKVVAKMQNLLFSPHILLF